MKRLTAGIVSIDKSLYVIAGSVLGFMIILTFFDVILRNLGHVMILPLSKGLPWTIT
jgi:hypothetical protein